MLGTSLVTNMAHVCFERDRNNMFQLEGTYYTTLACTEYMIYPRMIWFTCTSIYVQDHVEVPAYVVAKTTPPPCHGIDLPWGNVQAYCFPCHLNKFNYRVSPRWKKRPGIDPPLRIAPKSDILLLSVIQKLKSGLIYP